jgi:hypothetical protein
MSLMYDDGCLACQVVKDARKELLQRTNEDERDAEWEEVDGLVFDALLAVEQALRREAYHIYEYARMTTAECADRVLSSSLPRDARWRASSLLLEAEELLASLGERARRRR